LLVVANLAVTHANHPNLLDACLHTLGEFSKHRDVKCRQHAVFALGNLCSNHDNLERIIAAGCLKTIITYAFPSTDTSVNVQFQAIAGLRGLATHQTIRMQLVREGALEPLILAASTDSVEVQREVAATLCNLALAEENKVTMARSGVLPALVALAQSRDKERETHAVACLANLAEMVEGRTQRRMLDDGCLRPLLNLATSQDAEVAAHEDERARAAVLSTAFFAWRAHLFGHTDAWNRTNPRGELRLVLTILWRA
jgi:hypothetical protein